MSRVPRDPPDEAWTVFGRWRRRSRNSRRLGLALLILSLLLTLIWARAPRPALDPETLAPAGLQRLVAAAAETGCAPDAPAGALALTLPLAHPDDWDSYQGELVCLTMPLVIAEVYSRFQRGLVYAAAERPLAGPIAFERERSGVSLMHSSFASPAVLRNGDALLGVFGTLDRERVLRVAGFTLEVRNPRPLTPPVVGGEVRVAAFNLGNWSLSPSGRRGELTRDAQREKLVTALLALDADALVLSEVENDTSGAALQALMQALNHAQDAASRYATLASGRLGSDAIRVAILYRPAVLTLEGWARDAARVHLRPPLAAHLVPFGGGEPFTLIAAHHRSKGGCPSAGDIDRGSGCWNLQRDAQSQAILDFAAQLRADGWPAALLLGDLNAYRHEAPIERLARAGWRLAVDGMPAEHAYSFVYFGLAGALDHAAADPDFAARLMGATYWAINADEARGVDAREATPYRASDHDPLLLGVR